MEHQPNQQDAAIDKALAALRNAAPPEGMEARVAARIAQRLQQPAASRWPGFFAGFSLHDAWWRGALTGAATALLAACALLLLSHGLQSKRAPSANVASQAPTLRVIAVSSPRPDASSSPCAGPAVMRMHAAAPPPKAELLRASDKHYPILAGPLTAQERGLIQLVQTADPKSLVALSQENQTRQEAANAEQFDRFFAPPPRPPQPEPLNPQTEIAPDTAK